jgi:hypothetical protein
MIDNLRQIHRAWLAALKRESLAIDQNAKMLPPFPSVIWGYSQRGDERVPIYITDPDQLDKFIAREEGNLSAFPMKQRNIEERARHARLRAELAEKRRAFDAARAALGITAAEEACKQALRNFDSAIRKVTNYRPRTLPEAAMIARELALHEKNEECAEGTILRFVGSLGRAKAKS